MHKINSSAAARVCALMLALVLALSLAACGAKPASSAAPAPAAPESTPVSSTAGDIPADFLPPESTPEPTEEHTITGTVVGASMNTVTILTADGRDLTFPTVDAATSMKTGLLEGIIVTITYRGAEVTGTDTTGVHVDSVIDTSPEIEQVIVDIVNNMADCDETVYTTHRVHVRSSNEVTAEILATVDKGTQFHRTGKGSHGWSRVDYNGGVAYIFGDYLTTTAPASAVVVPAATNPDDIQPCDETVYTTVRLRMHETTDLGSNVLGVMPANAALHRVGTFAKGWSRVEYNGTTAFCDSEYLTTTPPAGGVNQDAPPAGDVNKFPADRTYTTTVALRLHVTYSTSSTTVVVVPKGTVLNVLNLMDNHWAEVSYEGRTLYCVTDYLV